MYGQRISIHQRCSELTRLLNSEENGNELKDAHRLFTTILGDIFGYSAGGVGLGWNLPAFSRKSSDFKDFSTLHAFLSSRGPLLQKLVHKLVSDPQSRRFEFPLSDLTAFCSSSSGPDPFILPRLAPDQSVLYLNAFEYYFFHFAYVLVRFQNQSQNINWVPGDALYPLLLEDYMGYFLPCDGSEVLGLSFPSQIHFSNSFRLNSPTHPNINTSHHHHHSLLKKPPTPSIPSSPSPSHPSQAPPFESIHSALTSEKLWRSEVLINVLSLFWLYSEESSESLNSPRSNILPHDASSSSFHHDLSPPESSSIRSSSTPFVPSVEHVRVVRMVVKHLHFFVNSAGPNNATFMDNFKAEVWPCLRRKLYLFLCSSLKYWPLDASFRLILETWLSYIQPWRYTNNKGALIESPELSKQLFKWHPFVIENNKFYTTIFKKVLGRFFRLDLSSNKNAYMLFRLCKVFDQAGLSDALRDVEEAHKGNSSATVGSFKFPSGISHRDMTVLIGHTNQNPFNVYGTDSLFDSMFEPEFLILVQKLLKEHIIPSYSDLRALLLSLAEESAKKKKDPWWWSLLFGPSSGCHDNSLMEVDLEETKKTVGYLESIVEQLISLFGLSPSYRNELKSVIDSAQLKHKSLSSFHEDDTIDCGSSFYYDPSSAPLSPDMKWKIINGMIKPEVRYMGNPDLALIRSDENKYLVRSLHGLSGWINSTFCRDAESNYERTDFLGFLFREVMTPSSLYYQNEKKNLGFMTPLEKQYIPPRIVLRPLASYKACIFIGAFYFIYMLIFGYSGLGASLTLFTYYFIFILCRAVYKFALYSLEKFYHE